MDYRHNVMNIDSIEEFLSIRGSLSNGQRDVYFVRSIGEMPNMADSINKIDAKMKEQMWTGKLAYIRINSLPMLRNTDDLATYSELYDAWSSGAAIRFSKIEGNALFQDAIKDACREIKKIFLDTKPSASESMTRNLVIKLLFWLDSTMADALKAWNENKCIKVVADNVEKEHEYIFYLFLTYLGCDVLLIENRKDVSVADKLEKYSHSFVIGAYGNTCLPEYDPKYEKPQQTTPRQEQPQQDKQTKTGNRSNVLVVPEHPRRKKSAMQPTIDARKQDTSGPAASVAARPVVSVAARPATSSNARTEKSFEELAQLASSIVLIAIHDKSGDIIGSGSGIMIGTKGYILTNNHVAAGGCYYSVRIEDDDEVYTTHEVIKYNSTTDLAVIRINRTLTPLKIYDGKKELVRGQKVVAIGSPLGLFNSVSDGIISGFRTIRDVDMIQFTAPISHGSSGGAVLNMYGEVIGISTAGIDSGQNINLAIGYESIRMFASGFMM